MNGLLSSIIQSQRRIPIINNNQNSNSNNVVFNQRTNNQRLHYNNMNQLLNERQIRNNILRRSRNNINLHNYNNNLNYFFNNRNITNEINNNNTLDDIDNSILNRDPLLSIPLETSQDICNNEIEFIDDEMFLETTLRDNNNNVTRLNFPVEDGIGYQTIFEIETYRIQYNHDRVMSPNDADHVLQGILSSMYDQEMMQQFNPGEYVNPGNNEEDINKIQSILTEKKYFEIKDIIKNISCPICVEDFIDDDNICMFTKCNHGFNAEYKDKFIKLFNRCPLCNDKLI
tara:strand:+ start:609 stop:1466 length:858 start_codon:yes stop_codon:yes gene_type:complete